MVRHIKAVILLKKFSFGLINFVNLSTTFFIQRFLTFLIFIIKTAFLTFLFLWSTFFTSMIYIAQYRGHTSSRAPYKQLHWVRQSTKLVTIQLLSYLK